MTALRSLLFTNRTAALLLIVLALAMRGIVPPGFMVRSDALVLSVAVCADAEGGHLTKAIVIEREGAPAQPAPGKHPACAFSVLGTAGLGSAPALVLALALAFILALGFAPQRSVAPRAPAHLRPRLRAPPRSR